MAITTNRQYLTASLSRFGITEQDIDLIMANYPKLDGAYSVTECRNAMFLSFSTVLPLANVSEGGYSKTWNVEALKLWYNVLCKELGKANVLQPTVRNASDKW